MELLTSAYWDVGNRQINQDSLVLEDVLIKNQRVIMALVADGIGGMQHGEIASGFIAERMTRGLFNDIKSMIVKNAGIKKIKKHLCKVLYEIHISMKEYARMNKVNLGSTVSLLFIYKRKYIILHLGDSAIYKFRRNKVKLITQLHTNKDGSINKCISNIQFHKPYEKIGHLRKNTGFLLCTDGYYKKLRLSEGVFAPKLFDSAEQIESYLKKMGDYVKEKGDADNKAAVYVLSR